MAVYLAVDIGGSAIKYACMDENYQISEKGKTETPLDCKNSLLEKLDRIFTEIVGRNYKTVEGVAVSMPGVIDRKKGYVYSGGRLEYLKNIEFVKELEDIFHKPVTICNDAKAAVFAEMVLGNLKGIDNGIVLVFGTGVGGGIMLDGRIYEGSHFSAGEFSSIVGSIEKKDDIMSIFAVSAGSYGLKTEALRHTGESDLDGITIFQKIREGDSNMLEAVKAFCRNISVYLYNLQAVLDVERVLIGGGISGDDLFIQLLRLESEKYFTSLAERNTILCPEILPCRFRNEANLIGAVYNYRMLQPEDKNAKQN